MENSTKKPNWGSTKNDHWTNESLHSVESAIECTLPKMNRQECIFWPYSLWFAPLAYNLIHWVKLSPIKTPYNVNFDASEENRTFMPNRFFADQAHDSQLAMYNTKFSMTTIPKWCTGTQIVSKTQTTMNSKCVKPMKMKWSKRNLPQVCFAFLPFFRSS